MTNELMVSIIVPCHNSGKYLRRTLNCLINQDFALRYKLICVNDSSSDNTLEILNEYKEKFSSLFEVISVNYSNLSQSRNSAFDLALEAKYICFCDSDDIPFFNFISSLYNSIEKSGSDISVLNFYQVKNNKVISKKNTYSTEFNLSSLKACSELIIDSKCRAYVWNKIFRSSLLKESGIKFIPEKFVYEDLVFSFQCFCKANYVHFENVAIYNYMIYSESLSHSGNVNGFIMHLNAYAACRMYSKFIFGEKKSLSIFKRKKKRMLYKIFCDLWPCRRSYKGKFILTLKKSYKLIKNICSKDFKIVDMPWEKYIIDLGYLKYQAIDNQ